jgi:taurine dioxygenase
MDLEIRPLSRIIGAEISGVDLSRELDAETVGAIRAAWLDHMVVVFPDQHMDEDDQTRFCRYFGDIELPMLSPSQDDEHPHVMFISNVRDMGLRTTLEDGEMMFHSDRSFHEFPFMATTLYAVEVPSRGGNTLFANCYASYEALSPDLKDRLEGRRAMNVYDYENNQVQKTQENSPDAPRFAQPIFRTHPETGRKSIYVSRLMTDYIVDAAPDESRDLLEQLFQCAEQPEFVYEHVWRAGDFVMWDNRCTMHARTDFDPGERRMLRRIAICGDRPF